MIEIIILIFAGRYISKLAVQKGLKPVHWVLFTIGSWLVFEFIGILLGLVLLNSLDFIALSFLGMSAGFGGFLLIRSILQKKPDITSEEDSNRIGVDDLKP